MYDFLIKHDIFDSQEEYFKNRTKAELIYMFSYNKEPGDKETIIRLYNDFVKMHSIWITKSITITVFTKGCIKG